MSYRHISVPRGAPPGTVWFGGPVQEFVVSVGELTLTSKEFDGDPDEALSVLLDRVPTDTGEVEAVCQVVLDTSNRGFTIPFSLMKRFADRDIGLRIEVTPSTQVDEPRGL
jgi:hypothetical protein